MEAPTLGPLRQHRLDNGLRIVLEPDSRLPLVVVNLWYHVGSKNERPGRTGFAHLFEHMLFQGSAHVPGTDHFRFIQQVGGVANGSTWFDRTNYFETLPAHELGLGLWLESDRMGFLLPALTPDKLETQRAVVMNERRERVDNQPYGRASERLSELVYPEGHPYRWPVIGTMEDIAAATLEDVHAFFATFYTPRNAVLTLVGDFDPDRALELVATYFGDLPGGPRPDPVVPVPFATTGEVRDVLTDEVRLSRLYLAFPAPAHGAPDWYAAELLAQILTGGKSSRLYEDLVYRREFARSISSSVLPTELPAHLTIAATVNPRVDEGELEREVLAELERLAANGPREEDLERARNQAATAHAGMLQSLDDRADLLALHATYHGDPAAAFREAAAYDAVSVEDLRRCAAALLAGPRAVLTVLPREAAS
ncbi:MAG: pitrilysin family protein [Thermoanaerobaculia bacterium]|nr:pitrilysin family protein [Thermoanaerobaculia bacterium]